MAASKTSSTFTQRPKPLARTTAINFADPAIQRELLDSPR